VTVAGEGRGRKGATEKASRSRVGAGTKGKRKGRAFAIYVLDHAGKGGKGK